MKRIILLFMCLPMFAMQAEADVPEGNITFEDPEVKAVCVSHWDTNGDGELSYAEAAAVTSIGNVFQGNTSITSFNELQYFIGLTNFECYAFEDSGLTSITIPQSMNSIGAYAFYHCKSLTSVAIPSSVTTIGEKAFQYCPNLSIINIPEGVTNIGKNAFEGCVNLISVTIPSSVTSIGSSAFFNTVVVLNFVSTTPCTKDGNIGANSTKLAVPHEAVAAYREAWASDANYIVDASLMNQTVEVTAKADASAVIEAIGEEHARDVVSLKVKGTFNGYDLMAFRNKMINLMHLDLSEANVVANSYKYYSSCSSKDNIITGYFAPTGIVSLKLPKDITALESSAFNGCRSLRVMELPEGITYIPQNAFYNCGSLTSVIIPESVTTIAAQAFAYCI